MRVEITLLILETIWLVFSLATFTLFWISKRKYTIFVIAGILMSLRVLWMLVMPWILKGAEVTYPILKTLSVFTLSLLAFVILYDQICLDKESPPSDKYFDLLSLGLLIGIAIVLINTFTVLKGITLDTHFLVLSILTIIFANITRKYPANDLLFQIFGVILVILWLALVIADPFIYGYRVDVSKINLEIILESVAKNAGWAYFLIMFFLGNLFQKGLINHIDNRKIFKWVFSIYIGSLVFRDPLLSLLAGKIPFFKDVVPLSLGAANFLIVPIIGFVRVINKNKNI